MAVLFFVTYESSLAARAPASSEMREGGISTTRHDLPRLQCSTALVRPREMKRSCQKGEVSEPRPGEKYAFSCLKSYAMWEGSPRYVKGGTPPEEEGATLAGRISPNQAAQMGRQGSLYLKGYIVGSNQGLMRPLYLQGHKPSRKGQRNALWLGKSRISASSDSGNLPVLVLVHN